MNAKRNTLNGHVRKKNVILKETKKASSKNSKLLAWPRGPASKCECEQECAVIERENE